MVTDKQIKIFIEEANGIYGSRWERTDCNQLNWQGRSKANEPGADSKTFVDWIPTACREQWKTISLHFPGEAGLAGVYWSKEWWRWWWQLNYWSYKSCKSSVKSPPSTNHHLVFFTGRMPFLSPNQQCQSTEGKNITFHGLRSLPQAHLGVFQLCLGPLWLPWGRGLPCLSSALWCRYPWTVEYNDILKICPERAEVSVDMAPTSDRKMYMPRAVYLEHIRSEDLWIYVNRTSTLQLQSVPSP